MSLVKIEIQKDENFIGVINFVDRNEEGEDLAGKSTRGFLLSNFLHTFTKDEYSLGNVEVIFDFNEDGKILSIEILQ